MAISDAIKDNTPFFLNKKIAERKASFVNKKASDQTKPATPIREKKLPEKKVVDN